LQPFVELAHLDRPHISLHEPRQLTASPGVISPTPTAAASEAIAAAASAAECSAGNWKRTDLSRRAKVTWSAPFSSRGTLFLSHTFAWALA